MAEDDAQQRLEVTRSGSGFRLEADALYVWDECLEEVVATATDALAGLGGGRRRIRVPPGARRRPAG